MPATKNPPFVTAPDVSLGSQLIDRIVALRPLRVEVVETKIGPSDATIADVLEIGDDGKIIDHGETPVFWSLVRRQLTFATEEQPWVVGRLVRSGQAYRLDSISEPETELVATAMRKYLNSK